MDTVADGSYSISRPFNLVTRDGEELSDAAQDFFNYIMSTDAADVISKEGYVAQGTESYTSNGAKGSVVVAGSSSVTPVMTKLKEAYADVNPDVTVDVQQSDSTTGVTSTQEGVCDIGMASRELKDTETGVKSTVLAMDGIAVIVNKDNSLDAITKDQIKQVYTGEITEWSALESK
ncbi:MAG: substrate-binding domain-containing protein [Ruminococcus callidus]